MSSNPKRPKRSTYINNISGYPDVMTLSEDEDPRDRVVAGSVEVAGALQNTANGHRDSELIAISHGEWVEAQEHAERAEAVEKELQDVQDLQDFLNSGQIKIEQIDNLQSPESKGVFAGDIFYSPLDDKVVSIEDGSSLGNYNYVNVITEYRLENGKTTMSARFLPREEAEEFVNTQELKLIEEGYDRTIERGREVPYQAEVMSRSPSKPEANGNLITYKFQPGDVVSLRIFRGRNNPATIIDCQTDYVDSLKCIGYMARFPNSVEPDKLFYISQEQIEGLDKRSAEHSVGSLDDDGGATLAVGPDSQQVSDASPNDSVDTTPEATLAAPTPTNATSSIRLDSGQSQAHVDSLGSKEKPNEFLDSLIGKNVQYKIRDKLKVSVIQGWQEDSGIIVLLVLNSYDKKLKIEQSNVIGIEGVEAEGSDLQEALNLAAARPSADEQQEEHGVEAKEGEEDKKDEAKEGEEDKKVEAKEGEEDKKDEAKDKESKKRRKLIKTYAKKLATKIAATHKREMTMLKESYKDGSLVATIGSIGIAGALSPRGAQVYSEINRYAMTDKFDSHEAVAPLSRKKINNFAKGYIKSVEQSKKSKEGNSSNTTKDDSSDKQPKKRRLSEASKRLKGAIKPKLIKTRKARNAGRTNPEFKDLISVQEVNDGWKQDRYIVGLGIDIDKQLNKAGEELVKEGYAEKTSDGKYRMKYSPQDELGFTREQYLSIIKILTQKDIRAI